MTKKDHPENGEEAKGHESPSAATMSAAAKRAQHALESAKDIVAQAHLDDVGAKAAAAASNLYREGRDRLADNEEQLSAAIRKNPLAAVGIAFSAGLLLALLARG
jgi:ElaB/YqjD/DUF883 family membrane-anchored ribosome-binding protein